MKQKKPLIDETAAAPAPAPRSAVSRRRGGAALGPSVEVQLVHQAPVVRLTGRAWRWVQLVRDFGHLDDESVDRLSMGVAELHPRIEGSSLGHPASVDVRLVQRAAAVMLFSPDSEGGPPLLEEDWPILFS